MCFLADSYAQRTEARKALSQDESFNNYEKKILKMLVKQVLSAPQKSVLMETKDSVTQVYLMRVKGVTV